jgi:hypothetical protein
MFANQVDIHAFLLNTSIACLMWSGIGAAFFASALIFSNAGSGKLDGATVSLTMSAGFILGAFVLLTQFRQVANQSSFTPF